MKIEYALTRTEILQGFLRSVVGSPRYLLTIVIYAIAMSGVVLMSRGAFSHSLTQADVVAAILAALGFMIFLPVMLFIRAKTSRRSLIVSSEGISTEIGRLKGQVPWRKIKLIVDTNRYILISRASGNAFFIPSRAFSNPQHQAEFVAAIKGWADAGDRKA